MKITSPEKARYYLLTNINAWFRNDKDEDETHLSSHAMLLEAVDKLYDSNMPASIKYHHTFPGGLVCHTAEVLYGCINIAALYSSSTKEMQNLIIAAIFHDIDKADRYIAKHDGWDYHSFVKHINHSSRSYMLYCMACQRHKVVESIDVSHMILSHHGKISWGACVEPETTLAWILHFADMLSSRE